MDEPENWYAFRNPPHPQFSLVAQFIEDAIGAVVLTAVFGALLAGLVFYSVNLGPTLRIILTWS